MTDSVENTQVTATQFETLNADKVTNNEEQKLDLILGIPVVISVEIGRTSMNIRNILQLNQGSLIELDRLAGDPLDLFVNGVLVAHGEVVVINDKFGVRLTDVISETERMERLR